MKKESSDPKSRRNIRSLEIQKLCKVKFSVVPVVMEHSDPQTGSITSRRNLGDLGPDQLVDNLGKMKGEYKVSAASG